MGLGLVKYVDQNGHEVKKPSVMKRRRYPVTAVITGMTGIPAFIMIVAIGVGGLGISTKLLLIAIVLVFFLLITGLSFIFEAQEKNHW